MEPSDNTTLILDLRDRMARIETKLDGHNDAHAVIDRRLDKIETNLDLARSDIDNAKARVATVGAIAGGAISILAFLGDHVWHLLPG